jgi:hypothetical protein
MAKNWTIKKKKVQRETGKVGGEGDDERDSGSRVARCSCKIENVRKMIVQ